uniref:Uncharacterized protein n=1 Tax=Anguilla anguilla TaxID=7936 RepID=A0A0E9UM36_ANGAN
MALYVLPWRTSKTNVICYFYFWFSYNLKEIHRLGMKLS